MDEIVRAVARREAAGVDWQVNAPLREMEGLYELFDAADRYLLDHPGHRVTVSIEREGGVLADAPSPDLLTGRAEV